MMKKVLSLLLAVILLASLTLTASTAEEEVFDGYVIVRLCNEGELYYGDDIYLYASVKSANMPYTITWQRSTGTRTQVAATSMAGSPMIFLVSTTIFHSSLVEPSSTNMISMSSPPRSTGTGWEDISGQHDEYYVFTATPESVNCEYRVVLTAE